MAAYKGEIMTKSKGHKTSLHKSVIVRWLSEIIVTGRIKAQFFVHEFLMMHLSILEGVPSSNFSPLAEKQNGCLFKAIKQRMNPKLKTPYQMH